MDGVFLSAQVAVLRKRVMDRPCTAIGVPAKEALGLVLGDGMLVLSARPDGPALWWDSPREMAGPASPSWGHHLEGGRVLSVEQPGADRVMVMEFSSGLLYGESGVRLIFEAAGRNANIILVRLTDGRILACWRKVPQNRCRYRSIAPGTLYVPPPPSGLPPGEWTSDTGLLDRLASGETPPEFLYHTLEGVGPATAKAILKDSAMTGEPVPAVVARLGKALLEENFNPWMTASGPLPIPLGPGEPLADPLAPGLWAMLPGTARKGGRSEWLSILEVRGARIRRKLDSLEAAVTGLVPVETLRLWGTLLLSKGDRSRGSSEAVLTDWEGRAHRIPLRPHRSAVENAGRYFRKAASADREKRNLTRLAAAAAREIGRIEEQVREAHSLSPEQLDALLAEASRKQRKVTQKRGGNPPLLLQGAWRCFVGRNAADNERVTFTVGRKGDMWFHVRGITGPHVVLKMDGRVDNPPARVMIEAAAAAARGSGTSSGVVPVDCTRVQYVRRVRQGKPGQVVYTREKTIFVDLDGLPGRERASAGLEENAGEDGDERIHPGTS
jgi:predicted ribosome quality control (RQC) complex YloA/Tae2 family protein